MGQQNRIPTRQGVYLRNPSAQSAPKKPAVSKEPQGSAGQHLHSGSAGNTANKRNTSNTASAKNTSSAAAGGRTSTPVRNGVQNGTRDGAVRQTSANGQKAPAASNAARNANAAAPSAVRTKTPLELVKERERKEMIERQKREKALAEKRKIELAKKKRKEDLAAMANGVRHVGRNILIGILAFLVLAAVIVLLGYRSMAKYKENSKEGSVELYEYKDPSEETGKEEKAPPKPLTLSDELKVAGDEIYFPYSAIEKFFGFTLSGDENSRTVMVGSSQSDYENTNTAVFFTDSGNVRVNGAEYTLKNAAYTENGELYIPLEFFNTFVNGIEITKTQKKGEERCTVTLTEPQVYFSASNNDPLPVPVLADLIGGAEFEYEYGMDLSEYEEYINPKDPSEYLILVNKDNKLAQDHVPEDLTGLIYTRKDRETQRMRKCAAMALEAFLKSAYAAGYSDVTVTSAYRSYAYQNSLFTTRFEQNKAIYGDVAAAEAKTAEFTAYPGASEHQTGLCCDMHNLPSAMQTFSGTDAYKWLYTHCADFGFILRYPITKEDVTGISYEPWHYRFVGRYHAQKIMESGMCLEEYVAQLGEDGMPKQ